MAKAAIRKMKKAEQDYKSILMRYKEAKCEVEAMNEELMNVLGSSFLSLRLFKLMLKWSGFFKET